MKVFSLLKEAREAAGLSLTQMSQRTGMDRSAISRLENGVYGNPTVKTLYKYVQALGKNILFKIVDDSK